MAENWIDALTRFGLPIVALIALAIFFAKSVWPWMTKQVEDTQRARERDLDGFRNEIKEFQKDTVAALRELTSEIRRGLR